MKVKIPTNVANAPAKTENRVVLDLRFRDAAEDPTAPAVVRNGTPVQAALARLGNTGWKKVQQYKVPREGTDIVDQFHVISKPDSGIVLIMESEGKGKELPSVRKIIMYAALDNHMVKKMSLSLPTGNERVVNPRTFQDVKRPSELLLIETNVTNIVEKMLHHIDFNSQPGRPLQHLFVKNWCGKRWGTAMFIPAALARRNAEALAAKRKDDSFSIDRSIASQSEAMERDFPDWFRQMVNTDEYHAFRNMRSKSPVKSAPATPKKLNKLATKFSQPKKKAA